MRNKKIFSLQALRGIAAMMVCLCHLPFSLSLYSNHFGLPHDDRFVPLDGWLNSGVDVFFVISGFVMSYVASGRKIDIEYCRIFILKRMLRIYPMYWLVLLAYGLYVFVFSGNAFQSVQQVVYSIFLLPGFRVMPLSWTLTFEILFYTLFAISMLISIFRGSKTYIGIALLFMFYFISFLFPDTKDHHSILQSAILFEFALGILLAKLFARGIFLSRTTAIMGIIAYLTIVVWNINDPLTYVSTYTWEHFGRWGISSALLVYSFLSLENSGVRFPALLLRIGDSSYSLYLLNSVLMVFFVKTWIKLGVPALISPYYLWCVLVVFAIATSYLAYVCFEKSMLNFSYKKFIYKS